jgi:hypothetical protein
MLTNSVVAQEELAFFNLTDVYGLFSVRYLMDSAQNEGVAGTSKAASSRLAEELKIVTKAYVYHPAFLNMTISGSPIFVQNDYDSDSGESKLRETLFGYNASFNFLNRKRYPFSIWFGRAHPEVSTGLSGRYRTVTNSYGIRGRLLMPVQLSWRFSHQDAKGSGFDATVDSDTDNASLRATFPYGRKNNLTLALNWTELDSRSGSPGLPIQPTNTETFSSELVGKNKFGSDNQFNLNQRLVKRRQDRKGGSQNELDTLLYSAFFDWDVAPRISSSSSYQFSDIQRIGVSQRSNALGTGAGFRLQNGVILSSNVRVSSLDSTSIARDRVDGKISARYAIQLPVGRLSLTGSARAGRTNQETSSDTFPVFDERIVLNGLIPAPLQEDFVVEDSLVVTNVDRTQTFIRDVDYRVTTIGSTTTIERLVTGNILDGQEVLASYDFLTGGTVKYGATSQSIGANLSVSTRTSFFLNLGNNDNEVLSGIAATPLNDSRHLEVGGKSSQPIGFGWTLGGEVRHLSQDEDISPFVRQTYNVFVQTPRFWNTRARMSFNRVQVDYEASREDVDANQYTLSIDSRLDGGIYLTYRGVASEDEGGSALRKNVWHTLQLSWRYRLVDFSLSARKSTATQGVTTRKDTQVTAEFRRFF